MPAREGDGDSRELCEAAAVPADPSATPMSAPPDNPFARLPRVDDVVAAAVDLVDRHGRPAVVEAVRAVLDRARQAVADGAAPPTPEEVVAGAAADLARLLRPGPRRVVNAAGVVVHTNLGRAPLSARAVQAVVAAAGYTDLEIDLDSGRRGSRGTHVDGLLAAAVGAEDAMAVNNCAAALVLVLAALAQGRQVLVSRGHLVEIGGSFRLPDIMAASGAHLHEVGTTNRTHLRDYREGSDVAALLTVHPSNFSTDGFVTAPDQADIAAVAAERGIPLVHDAGSGLLAPSDHPALADEPSMAAALQAGAALVVASGDKLLGGPQAGLIAGDADLVARCRRHPLARALRLDKLRLAALSATLTDHLQGVGSRVDAMLADYPALAARIATLAERIGPPATVTTASTMVGGGSAPGMGVTSPVVRLPHPRPDRVAAAMRKADPPVVARVHDGAVLLDLRTVEPADDDHVVATTRSAAADLADDADTPDDATADAVDVPADVDR